MADVVMDDVVIVIDVDASRAQRAQRRVGAQLALLNRAEGRALRLQYRARQIARRRRRRG